MRVGIVQARSLEFFLAHGFAAFHALGIRFAEGEMAGSIFVEKGVVEENFLVGDGTVVGDERDLAEIRRALVLGDGGAQDVLALFGVQVDDPAVLDDKVEILNDVAVVDKRHGGIDHAVDAGLKRGGEDLLGRHVGDEGVARAAEVAAAGPDVRFRQADRKIRAERVAVVQGDKVQCVECCDAAFEQCHVLAPARDRVALAADADGGEDRVPEPVHRLLLGKIGEDLLRPARDGNGGNAPGASVRHHSVYIGLDGRFAAARARQAVGVYTAQRLGITGGDIEECCALVSIAVEHFCLPDGENVEHGVVRAQKALTVHVVVRPAHHDLAAADVVGCGGAQARERRTVDGARDDERLPLLHVEADLNEQFCIFSEFIFHGMPS